MLELADFEIYWILQICLFTCPIVLEDEFEGLLYTWIGNRRSRVFSGHFKGELLRTDLGGFTTREGRSLGFLGRDRESLGACVIRNPRLGTKGLAINCGDGGVKVRGKATAYRNIC